MKSNESKTWRLNFPCTIAAMAISLAIAACSGPSDQSPPQTTSDASSVSPPATASTSSMTTPDSSAAKQAQTPAVGGASPADTATASDPAMKSMTKQEESTSMPMPAQANDHSTVVKDSKK